MKWRLLKKINLRQHEALYNDIISKIISKFYIHLFSVKKSIFCALYPFNYMAFQLRKWFSHIVFVTLIAIDIYITKMKTYDIINILLYGTIANTEKNAVHVSLLLDHI
jgi:hypothetical protein